MCKHILMMLMVFIMVVTSSGQSPHKLRLDGDKLYREKKYEEASKNYQKAGGLEDNAISSYNNGNSQMQLKKYDEAITSYDKAVASVKPKEKAQAFYNLGNAYVEQKKYSDGINAYKNALKYDADDTATKENLAIARKALRQQQQQQQQQQNQQNQNKEKSDQPNKDPKNQRPDNQDNKKESNQPSQNEPQEDPNQPNPNQQKPSSMSKDQAERLLNMIDDQEKKANKRLKRNDGQHSKSGKDW